MQHPQDIHIAFAANASSHHLPRLTPHTNSILLPVLSPPALTTPASLSYNPSKTFQVPSVHITMPSLRPTRSRLLPRHRRYVHPRPPAQQPLLNQIASFTRSWLRAHPLSLDRTCAVPHPISCLPFTCYEIHPMWCSILVHLGDSLSSNTGPKLPSTIFGKQSFIYSMIFMAKTYPKVRFKTEHELAARPHGCFTDPTCQIVGHHYPRFFACLEQCQAFVVLPVVLLEKRGRPRIHTPIPLPSNSYEMVPNKYKSPIVSMKCFILWRGN